MRLHFEESSRVNMSVAALLPANSVGARNTAVSAFEAFLRTQTVTLDEAHTRIASDPLGKNMHVI